MYCKHRQKESLTLSGHVTAEMTRGKDVVVYKGDRGNISLTSIMTTIWPSSRRFNSQWDCLQNNEESFRMNYTQKLKVYFEKRLEKGWDDNGRKQSLARMQEGLLSMYPWHHDIPPENYIQVYIAEFVCKITKNPTASNRARSLRMKV